ncbi:hypothetical protein ACTWP5_21790 [Streptomyces sp. 4N509B]|uniref:hypothetical protein n=1 Tax=Streptomyces sp. 4N509B TaxID=3457413 RepID=UPI003FD28CBF
MPSPPARTTDVGAVMKQPLPPYPPEPGAPVSDWAAVLAARAEALDVVLARDLSLGRLLWRTAQTVLLALAVFVAAVAWDETRREGGEDGVGYGFLALGVLVFAGTAATVVRGWSAQRRLTRLLRAWCRVVDRQATGTDPRPPGPPAPPGGQEAPGEWETVALVLRGQRAAGGGGPRRRSYGPGEDTPSSFTVSRTAWASVGGTALVVGLVNLLAWASGDADVSGVEHDAAGTLIVAGVGGVFAASGLLAVWKAFRLAGSARRVAPRWRPSPGKQGVIVRSWTRHRSGRSMPDLDPDGRMLLPDLLARVTPGGAFDRRHRAASGVVLALGAGVVAAVPILVTGGLLGQVAVLVSIPFTLAVVVALGGYRRRPLWPLLALLLAVGVLVPGLRLEQQRVLAERGVRVEATVVDVEELPEYQRCELEFDGGRPAERLRCPDTLGVGERTEVVVDPEGEVRTGFSEPSPTGYLQIILGLSAAFVLTVAVGTHAGHRFRRSLAGTVTVRLPAQPPPPAPAPHDPPTGPHGA